MLYYLEYFWWGVSMLFRHNWLDWYDLFGLVRNNDTSFVEIVSNFGYPSLENFIALLLSSTSGAIYLFQKLTFNTPTVIFLVFLVLVACVDFFLLSSISRHNQQKYQDKNPSHKTFIVVFLLWRLLLPDFFVASSVLALATKVQLSKKSIAVLVILAQVLRICAFGVVFLFSVF